MQTAGVVSKSQFADQLQRHPSQITRWIADKKLTGDALVGEGRGTRINVAEALRQLNIHLNIGQQLAQDRPVPAAPQLDLAAPAADYAGIDAVEAGRLEKIRLDNARLRQQIERGAREDAVAAGQLVDVAAMRRALARQLQPLRALFDQLPAAIAKPISEQFGLAYPEVLIAVRAALRGKQMAMAETLETLERSTAA